MVKPIVKPETEMSLEEIQNIPMDERGKYYERYLYQFVKNQKEGTTLSEVQQLTGLPKPTLSKYLELLFSKRKIFKVKKGKFVVYKPNGQIFHALFERDLLLHTNEKGDIKKYRIYLIENPDGKFLYLQEKQVDGNGFEDVVGGVMIPLHSLPLLIEKFEHITHMDLKIEE